MPRRGWLTLYSTKTMGMIRVFHWYRINPKTGNRTENTCNLGPLAQFPDEDDAWAEVKRRHLLPNSSQVICGRVTVAELISNYRKRSLTKLRITSQATTSHILDDYLQPRWGETLALEITPDDIEEWLNSLQLANPTKEKIRRVMNVVYRQGQKSRLLPMTGDGNPVKFVTQSSKSNYRAVLVSPEQAFQIMAELEDPYRMLVYLVAVTGLRISEALGLQWRDLDYEGKKIDLHRAWVGNELIEDLKTERSGAPVPLCDLLADGLRGWHKQSPYAKSEDWIFPSFKLSGKTPLSASITAADKLRPAAIKAGVRLEPGQRFGFHNLRHSLATFLIGRGKNTKTVQELMRHAKVTTTLDLYSQAIDAAKLDAQQEIALAITDGGNGRLNFNAGEKRRGSSDEDSGYVIGKKW
jgi:integrase